jgi:hypothetical protein
MPAGSFTINTRTTGEVLTAAKYNADNQNVVDNFDPQHMDDYSANTTAMQTKTDPGEVGSESLATALAGEVERLRYAVYDTKLAIDPTIVQWYETPFGLGWHNVKGYGAVGNGTTDDTTALQAALNAANTAGGGVVYLPKGSYKTTSALTVYANTTVQGAGPLISYLLSAHSGDAMKSTGNIDSATRKNINLRDFGITANTTDSGNGYVDVGDAFLTFERMFFQGFNYNLLLDQTEHASIHDCEFLVKNGVGIWLVSGPEHTVGADPQFTNVISIQDCQFNVLSGSTTAVHIRDDGGVNHNISNSNFNAGTIGIRAANASMLRVEGNFFESQTSIPLSLKNSTALAGTTYGANYSPVIRSNAFSSTSGATTHIQIENALGGSIVDNSFVGSSGQTSCIHVTSPVVAGLRIAGNTKYIDSGTANEQPFMNVSLANLSGIKYHQRLYSTSASSANAGAGQVITPRDMGLQGTAAFPKVGDKVFIMNTPLGLQEITTITAVTTTTFTATLANSYNANFGVFGLGETFVNEPIPTDLEAGTGSIVTGAGPWNTTITHGLGYIPAASDIVITPTAAPSNAVGLMWLSTIGGTSFQVNISADPGANPYNFSWRIFKPPFRA